MDIASISEVFLFEPFLRLFQETPTSGIYILFDEVVMEIVFGED
jgi:hypothetical protein